MSQRLAAWLVRLRVAPNTISLAGMVCGVAAGALLAATPLLSPIEQRFAWAAGALCILLRLLANMLDGMVAVASGRASPVGELYNEVPDRISDAATLIGLGYAPGGSAPLGYLAACMAILTAYVRAMGKAAGAPQQFCGPMAKQQRMAIVVAVALYAALAPVAWQTAWDWPHPCGLPAAALALIVAGTVWTIIRRLSRTATFLRNRPHTEQ
jgi:phosphatidylglycerophosphate synthase